MCSADVGVRRRPRRATLAASAESLAHTVRRVGVIVAHDLRVDDVGQRRVVGDQDREQEREQEREGEGGRAPERGRPLHAAARSGGTRTLLEVPLLVAVALVVTLVFKAWLAQAFYIPSASMEPQLREHDRVLVSRTAYRLHEPNRGDIIVFPSPTNPPEDDNLLEAIVDDLLDTVALGDRGDEEVIKRVVGLPGEVVEGRDGGVVIDGRPLIEPYLPADTVTSDFGPVAVPEGEVFVLGDNRTNSHDSRFADVGTIEIDSIVGRAIARIWPPSRTAFL